MKTAAEKKFVRLRKQWNAAYQAVCNIEREVERTREAWCQHPGPKRFSAHFDAVTALRCANVVYAALTFDYAGRYGGS